eukprot:507328-Hanusia_phi.AAC.4
MRTTRRSCFSPCFSISISLSTHKTSSKNVSSLVRHQRPSPPEVRPVSSSPHHPGCSLSPVSSVMPDSTNRSRGSVRSCSNTSHAHCQHSRIRAPEAPVGPTTPKAPAVPEVPAKRSHEDFE